MIMVFNFPTLFITGMHIVLQFLDDLVPLIDMENAVNSVCAERGSPAFASTFPPGSAG